MKLTKKKLFVTALCISLVAILSVGSLAWFSASDSTTNDFFFADSEDDQDPDKIFSIDVWEEIDKDGDGDISDDEKTDDGIVYENIVPGSTYDKNVFVKNTGIHDQYVRVFVTLTDYAAWVDILGDNFDVTSLLVGFDANLWAVTERSVDVAQDTVTCVLYAADVLVPGTVITPFTAVTIPGEQIEVEDIASFGDDGFSIVVTAQAVQTANLGNTAYEAFANANI